MAPVAQLVKRTTRKEWRPRFESGPGHIFFPQKLFNRQNLTSEINFNEMVEF